MSEFDEFYVKFTIDIKSLTLQEAAIVKSHCYRDSDQQIADENGISINTLKTHRKNILKKKNVGRIGQLITREEIEIS